jgi:hypothetical protein
MEQSPSGVWSCYHLAQTPYWRANPSRLSVTIYSIYSQIPSKSVCSSSIRNLRTRQVVIINTHLITIHKHCTGNKLEVKMSKAVQ